MDDLTSMAPNQCKAKIELLGTYDPQGERIIRDPYYVSPNLLLYLQTLVLAIIAPHYLKIMIIFLSCRTMVKRVLKNATSSAYDAVELS